MSVPAETLGTLTQREDGSRLAAVATPDSLAADQYRLLLARLDRAAVARPLRTVAITSTVRGEGRSTTAANLALTAAREGREVALVDCDLRRPGLANLFELAPRPGLAEVAEGSAELSQALTLVDGVSLLCAGESRDPAATLRSPRLAAAIDALRSTHALVVLDGPPAIALAEAGRLASVVDGTVLVVRAGQTPKDLVRLAVDALSARLLGIVLNGVEEPGYARYLRADAA